MSVIGDSFTGCDCEEDCSQKECCLKFSGNDCSIKIKATDKIAHLISLSKLLKAILKETDFPVDFEATCEDGEVYTLDGAYNHASLQRKIMRDSDKSIRVFTTPTEYFCIANNVTECSTLVTFPNRDNFDSITKAYFTSASATDSSSADATDSSSADATDSSSAGADDFSSAGATESANVDSATDSSSVDATDSSSADATDSSSADATDSSSAGATDSANVDSATDSLSEDVNGAKLAAPTSQMGTRYIYRSFLLSKLLPMAVSG